MSTRKSKSKEMIVVETAENPENTREYDVPNEIVANDTEIQLETIESDSEDSSCGVDSIYHNLESEFVMENEMPSEPEKSEIKELIEQEITQLLVEREQLLNRIDEIKGRLIDLGHNALDEGTSKTEICKRWIAKNPKCTRSEFMEVMKEIKLGSPAMLSTYWQKLKPHK